MLSPSRARRPRNLGDRDRATGPASLTSLLSLLVGAESIGWAGGTSIRVPCTLRIIIPDAVIPDDLDYSRIVPSMHDDMLLLWLRTPPRSLTQC